MDELQNTNVTTDTQEGTKEVTTEEANTETAEGTENATEETTAAAEQTPEAQEEAPYMVARYNKKDVPLTREKAQEWAQKGMHYSDKLEYLAAIRGTTVADMLKQSISKIDEDERARLEEQFGDDTETIDSMMRVFHEKNQAKYEKAMADMREKEAEQEKNRIAEIGDEFIALQKDFPELKEIKDIPPSVLKEAAKTNLEHAYLKYLHNENKKIEAAKKAQEAAESQSAGSLQNAKKTEDDLISVMVRAVGNN